MNYTESVEYLKSKSALGSRPGTERISRLADLLGNPQERVPVIHVTGTNGKGSFCAMLESVLRAAGYSTGLFVSPYFRRFNECIRLSGAEITDDEFAGIMSKIRLCADSMDDSPTEFELLTAAAYESFASHGCDVAIVEVGMGGRLDSTNIISSPVLSVITGVSLDHMNFLGDTLEKIAAEKAGIIKPGCTVLWGGSSCEAERVIRERAEKLVSNFYAVDHSLLGNITCSISGSDFDFAGLCRLHIPLLGLYQPVNAANVVSAVTILRQRGFKIPDAAIYRGLSSVAWEGRFELLSRDPVVIYDGSHNPEGVSAARRSIEALFPGQRVNLLSGVLRDKDYRQIAQILSGVARHVFTITPPNSRALQAADYAEVYKGLGVLADSYPTLAEGVRAAYADTLESGVPLIILGSLYMYANVRSALGF